MTSLPERWTSRDLDLSKTSGRKSALTNLELVRPDHAVFSPPCSGFNVPISNGRRSDREKYIVYSCSLLVQKQLSFGGAHVVVECASDTLIPTFLRLTLDTFWRARIDLCMHGLVQPQTHLPIFPSVFVYTSSQVVFEALDRRCDGHRGLPHAVLTSESVRHVSFLPKQLVDLFVKIMVKTRVPLCAREIRKRCEELACPAEDDEQVDKRVDEPVAVEDDEQVEFQEEEQPERDLHAAEIMLRRVHANLGHPSKGLMLRPVLAVEQPTEVESQVAAVVWLAHGGFLIRAAPEHLVGCSSLDTSLFEVANPDSALPGASWLRDLRNLRRTEYADLGNPPTESERLDAWQDPDGREQQQFGHLFPLSSDPVVVPAPPTPESQFPQQPVRNPDNSSSRVSAVRFRHRCGRFLSQSDSHQSAHDES